MKRDWDFKTLAIGSAVAIFLLGLMACEFGKELIKGTKEIWREIRKALQKAKLSRK